MHLSRKCLYLTNYDKISQHVVSKGSIVNCQCFGSGKGWTQTLKLVFFYNVGTFRTQVLRAYTYFETPFWIKKYDSHQTRRKYLKIYNAPKDRHLADHVCFSMFNVCLPMFNQHLYCHSVIVFVDFCDLCYIYLCSLLTLQVLARLPKWQQRNPEGYGSPKSNHWK